LRPTALRYRRALFAGTVTRRAAGPQRDSLPLGERARFGGQPLVIGETIALEHFLMARVINDGEAPEYVHSITLESEVPSPLRVVVKEPVGTVEVRPRDQALFESR
jgi:hypothetical protein